MSSCCVALCLVVGSIFVASCAPTAGEVEQAISTNRGTIANGKVRHWPEATQYLRFDISGDSVTAALGPPRPTGFDALWSIASTTPRTGFFYADSIRGTGETRVAFASDTTRVSDIHDAAALDFTKESVGPVPVGGIVVIEHEPTRRFLAIVVDAIEPTDPKTAGAGPYAHADITWYLTPPGQADFSDAVQTESSAPVLGGSARFHSARTNTEKWPGGRDRAGTAHQ